MGVEIRLLGRPRSWRDGVEILLRGHKAWLLLAKLLVDDVPASRDRLARMLFVDAADPAAALRWNLSQLRRCLDLHLDGDPRSRAWRGVAAGSASDNTCAATSNSHRWHATTAASSFGDSGRRIDGADSSYIRAASSSSARAGVGSSSSVATSPRATAPRPPAATPTARGHRRSAPWHEARPRRRRPDARWRRPRSRCHRTARQPPRAQRCAPTRRAVPGPRHRPRPRRGAARSQRRARRCAGGCQRRRRCPRDDPA